MQSIHVVDRSLYNANDARAVAATPNRSMTGIAQ